MSMTWDFIDTWIVITGALCAVACALPGCFLVLRRMSMMGDAISHAVLPGLAGGYLMMVWVKESAWIAAAFPESADWIHALDARNPLVMLAGATLIGVLTTVFTQWISTFGRVDRGAAMGIVFTTLFAIGLILLVRATESDHVDLDPGCVLYGAIELTPLDAVAQFTVGGQPVRLPRAAAVTGVVMLVNLAVIVAMFKEFRISAFDPELATTVGVNATVMHYLLMVMVAVTTVASFEVVGSIIVIAMLIVPAAAAHLLTDRLGLMLGIAAAVAVAASVLGHLAAQLVPPAPGFESTTTAGAMASAAGVIFLVIWIVSPRHGLLRRWFGRVEDAAPAPAATP